MKKEEEIEKIKAKNQEYEEIPVLTAFFILAFFSVISYILFKLYKIYKIWPIYFLSFFIFLFGFQASVHRIIDDYKKNNPSHPLFKLSKFSALNYSLIISSVPILLFYLHTKSTIIAIAFLFYFLGGITGSELRKIKLVFYFLTILALITFYYSYDKKDFLWHIFSTFIFAYLFISISEYFGKNLENKNPIKFSGFMLIVSLSVGLFSNYFIRIEILNTIGLLASAFFGFFFLELSLISYLKNILIFRKEDQYYVFNLIFIFLSLLLFSIFIFYKYNMYIYIVASLCLSFGVISLKLILQKYFSDKISRDISFSIGFGILGITITIFYFLFIKVSIIVFIGITLIIFSSRVLYKTIGKAKLEFELNEKIDR